jgi:hypothetical protein
MTRRLLAALRRLLERLRLRRSQEPPVLVVARLDGLPDGEDVQALRLEPQEAATPSLGGAVPHPIGGSGVHIRTARDAELLVQRHT